jgi:hypothetical protein
MSLLSLKSKHKLILLVATCTIGMNSIANSQDFRVYTSVVNLGAINQEPTGEAKSSAPVIARSLTFFHAGKTYDYMDEVGELVIFEPAHERFLILNGKLLKKTQLEFSQLKQFLKVADNEAYKYLVDLETKIDPASMAERNLLKFQLTPTFVEELDLSKRKLVCQSVPLTYTMTYSEKVNSEYAEAYLAYADWAVRLNYVLHSQSLMPGPRLQVNAALKRIKTIPTSVELKSDPSLGLHLRAEHTIRWELDATDRSRITDWERLLQSPQVPAVTFHDYQKLLMNAQGVTLTTDEK